MCGKDDYYGSKFDFHEFCGLKAQIMGGYLSPGCLKDLESCHFVLCEKCLKKLIKMFKVPIIKMRYIEG